MKFSRIAALSICASAFVLPAWAEKPDFAAEPKPKWEQGEKGDKAGKGPRTERERPGAERRDPPSPPGLDGLRFDERHRESVHGYYAPKVKAGRCPPGLAKKANGCLPPGQAKQWALGQALPSDLRRYPLPAELLRRLGPPPAGHEYVRVAGDILLLAIGTSMVVDAIENLGGF